MPVTFYDPEVTPEPRAWLALDESERLRLVQSFHRAARTRLPNAKVHAAIHVVVENQIATGFAPSCRAMERLQAQGLTRHEAAHAIGSVLAKFVHELSNPQAGPQPEFNSRMNAAIDGLSAEQWKAMGEGSEE